MPALNDDETVSPRACVCVGDENKRKKREERALESKPSAKLLSGHCFGGARGGFGAGLGESGEGIVWEQ